MEPDLLIESMAGALLLADGEHIVDLRARYSVLNVNFDLKARECRLGIFGESRVATIACRGVTRMFSPTSQISAPYLDMTDAGLITRPDVFEIESTGQAATGDRFNFEFATDGGVAFALRTSEIGLYRESLNRGTPADVTGMSTARWAKPHRGDWVLEGASEVPPTLGLVLEQVELDLVNALVRLVISDRSRRWLVEFQGVQRLRIGPDSGADMVAEIADTPPAGAPISWFAPESRIDPIDPSRWCTVKTHSGFELATQASVTSIGLISKVIDIAPS